jgi:transcriptional regulator with XRE-family HTH domain
MAKARYHFDSELLHKARIKTGLTQVELSKKIGVSQALVSNWEKGKLAPKDSELKSLTKVFGSIFRNESLTNSDSENQDELAGISSIGVWLNKEMTQSKLTVAEVSTASGIAIPTIYAILSGKIQNPRDSTIEQLEKALKKSLPEETRKEEEEESIVEGVGEMKDFNPHDPNDLPAVGGVYVFYDITKRPIYVGKSKRIDIRVKQHSDNFWFRTPIVYSATYIKIDSEILRLQIEKVLIKFLKDNAVINKNNVDRGIANT